MRLLQLSPEVNDFLLQRLVFLLEASVGVSLLFHSKTHAEKVWMDTRVRDGGRGQRQPDSQRGGNNWKRCTNVPLVNPAITGGAPHR